MQTRSGQRLISHEPHRRQHRQHVIVLAQELGPVDGICSFAEAGTPLAAALAQAFGLPGNDASAVVGTCDKV